MSSSSHSYSKTEDQTTQPCCAKASSELKLYQAFIFSVPIFSIFILAFFFYLFYLCCFRRPQSRPASLHTTDDDDFSTSELGLKKEHREMLPIIIFKETFSVKDTHKGSDATSSAPSQNQQTRTNGQQILQSLANMRNTNSTSSGQLPPALGRIMESVQMGGQGADGQFDAASVMSQVLHSPALNGLLAGVSEQTGVGCSVCLADYQAEDRLQQIPACGHTFHTDCIDLWLATHTTCPLCRLSLIASAKASTEPLDAPETSSRYHPPVAAGDETQSHQIGYQTCEESWISQQCSGSGNGDERSLEMSNGEERTNSEFVERDRH
ncbi:unnamed protein product [Camellia sinensis]